MTTPWAVILCKFTDGDDEPFPLQRYKDMFTTSNTGSKWNMIKYFSGTHDTLDLTGTQIFGWFKLDKSVADYNGPNGGRTELIKWARKAATDNGVDPPLAPSLPQPLEGHRIGGRESYRRDHAQSQLLGRDGPCLRMNHSASTAQPPTTWIVDIMSG
jgi:hypothetical protein